MATQPDPPKTVMAFCVGCKLNKACLNFKGHTLCKKCWPKRNRMFGK